MNISAVRVKVGNGDVRVGDANVGSDAWVLVSDLPAGTESDERLVVVRNVERLPDERMALSEGPFYPVKNSKLLFDALDEQVANEREAELRARETRFIAQQSALAAASTVEHDVDTARKHVGKSAPAAPAAS